MAGSLWYTNFLGEMLEAGFHQVYRQVIFANSYASLAYDAQYELVGISEACKTHLGECEVLLNPDYFVTLLWRRLVGSVSLQSATEPPASQFAVHSACYRAGTGEIVLAFSNFAHSPQALATNHSTPRDEYIISADALTSTPVRLNGVILTNADQLVPKHVPSGPAAAGITVPAHSTGFLVLLGANASACW